MKFEKPVQAGSGQVRRPNRKSGGARNVGAVDPGIKVLESPQASKASLVRQPVQCARQARRVEHTDELMMKADELERLFLEHQLRGPSNHSILLGKEGAGRSPPGYEETCLAGYSGSSRSALFLGDPRGKYYERYMEKRDAKLREEWRTRRVEKEMKLRALWDCYDQISAEMKAKLFRLPEGYDSIGRARFRMEKLRSFNARTNVPWTQQGHRSGSDNVGTVEEAHEPFEFEIYHNNQFPDQSTVSPVPRSPLRKPSNSASATPSGQSRQTQYHVSRSMSSTYSREELPPLKKEEKPTRRSQSMRSSASNSGTVISLKTVAVKHSGNGQGFNDLVGMSRQGRKVWA